MTDWCLYGEAVTAEGELFKMAPDIVIVNVPETVLDRQGIFRFLKSKVGRKEFGLLSGKMVARKHWGTMKLYSRLGKILIGMGFYQKYFEDRLTLIQLAREIPEELRRGFLAFGDGFLIRFYDWNGGSDEVLMKKEFAIRQPELAESLISKIGDDNSEEKG